MDSAILTPDIKAEDDDAEAHRTLISQSMGRWRMLIGRRVISRLAIRNVAPGLEITHLDVLDAVWRAQPEGEVTVGTIAEFMRIDPSRASRIIADMVARGALRREASQTDARRIIVVMTEFGNTLMLEVKAVKHGLIESILADWPEEDVASFSRLFDKFVTSFEQVYQAREKESPPETGA